MRAFHNSPADSSEKSAENPVLSVDSLAPRRKRFSLTEAMQAAISLAKRFGLPLTHRNLYVIELAILAERDFREVSLWEAAAYVREGAMAAKLRGVELNYFFFEDASWRPNRETRAENDLGDREGLKCWYCNDRGYVFNYGPGKRTRPCPECQAEVST